jgi:hypothetical protein
MELKIEFKIKLKGGFKMKFKSWKKIKAFPKLSWPWLGKSKEEPKDEAREAIEKMLEKGILIRIDKRGSFFPVEEEGAVLERLGVAMSVVYDPTHGQEYRRPWVIRAPLQFNYRGHCFGIDGASLVKSIGLEFPNAVTPWADDVGVEDGVLEWKRRVRPDAQEIAQVVQEAQRQVAQIMRHFGETKAILDAVKKGGDSQ